MLEDHRDVVEGLSDTADTLLSHRINEVIKILTIISVVMLPLTLLAGIYGMNVMLPLAHSPWAFPFVLALMVLITTGMLFYFKRRGWL
jgi:magnesium transporter